MLPIWDQKPRLLFCPPVRFAPPCLPVPQKHPPVHRELLGTHHPILMLEGTRHRDPSWIPFIFPPVLPVDRPASILALRLQLEGEGADSGEEQRVGGGFACCSRFPFWIQLGWVVTAGRS